MSATHTIRARHARLLAAALAAGCLPFVVSTASAGAGYATATSVTVPLVDDDLAPTTTVCIGDVVDTATTLCLAPSDTTTTTAPATTTTTASAAPTTTAPARSPSTRSSVGSTPSQETDGRAPQARPVAGPALGAPSVPGGRTVDPLGALAAGAPDIGTGGAQYTPRPGARSTVDLISRIGRGVPPERVARLVAPFPVAGSASYSDDFGAYRHGPPVHPHAGADVFAARGTPVVASIDGAVGAMTRNSRLGGISLRVTGPDGTYLYYAHLSDFAPDLAAGQQVEVGDIVGYVGNTGNARHTPAHVHFEIHPEGGPAVNPTPYLDRWLDEARTRLQLSVSDSSTPPAAELEPARARSGSRASGDNVVPRHEPVAPISALGIEPFGGPRGVPALAVVTAGAGGWWWITRPRLHRRRVGLAHWRR